MRSNPFHNSVLGCCFSALLLGAAASSPAQSNIVFNGSFEAIADGWTWGGGLGVYPNQGAPDGQLFISVEGFVLQDLDTVPGRDYVLTFAAAASGPLPAVTWGATSIPSLTNFASAGVTWAYRYCYVHADSSVTQLRFDGAHAILDDVKAGWVQDPIQLIEQPEGRTSYEGASASFIVAAA